MKRLHILHASLLAVTPFLGLACGGESPATDTGDNTQSETLACDGDVCVLTGTITDDLTLTADKAWLLRGGVFIGDDVNETVLTIEPGTTLFGETSTNGMLVIRRGSKIIAEGTAEAPIVMTSSKEDGSRARGDWGGLIVNGRAPVNGCDEAPCEAFGEGGTGFYGEADADDSSGVLKYVRVEFAGTLISPDNELNGVAFQGVGRGTEVDYLQVHMGADDGVEFFGGTVNVKHVLVTGVADDSIDWTDGWQGKAQFLVVQQYEDAGDNGIEADNNAENNAAAPRSSPMISNVTLIGSPESDLSDLGILLREGTGANLANFIVTGFNDACLDIDHDETFANALTEAGALTGNLTLEHSILDCNKLYVEDEGEAIDLKTFVEDLNTGNQVVDAGLEQPFSEAGPDFRPATTSPSTSGAVVFDDSFFTNVSFKGGVDPLNDWTRGWTTSARN
ncbi:MAG: hypothetical protein ACO3JL_05000 [Myxococcota bacterium]